MAQAVEQAPEFKSQCCQKKRKRKATNINGKTTKSIK
jgi:hypothetical protein